MKVNTKNHKMKVGRRVLLLLAAIWGKIYVSTPKVHKHPVSSEN